MTENDNVTEKKTEMLSPMNPNLKDSVFCAYREGKKCYEDKLDPYRALDIGINLAEQGKPPCTSFEALFYFTLGIMGKMCEKQKQNWEGKDYCKEGCKLVCEYNGSAPSFEANGS